MLFAFLVFAAMPDWTPARWQSSDPASLELLRDTTINCLLLEQKHWSSPFIAKANEQGIAVMGVVRPTPSAMQAIRTAKEQKLQGVVLEGDFAEDDAKKARDLAKSLDMARVELPSRRGIRFDSGDLIVGTTLGVWPGVRPADDKDHSGAMPSGGPWIDTNTGFLRFAGAMHKGGFWMANTPPAGQVFPAVRYAQVIADAAAVGAQWVLSLDDDFFKRLLAKEANAVRDWKLILDHAKFYADRKNTRDYPAYTRLAVVQDASNGALLSGGVLDMIAVKHTPVRPVPGSKLGPQSLDKATLAVNVDPAGLTEQQKEALKNFTRSGGTVLNGPPDWKMPSSSKNQLTVDEEDVKKLDQIWKEMNSLIQRRNLGVRLFNVSAMLSYMQSAADGKRSVLHLVNYSGYPVEAVTAHVLGRYKKAFLETPDGKRKALETFEVEDGTGIEIDVVPVAAVVVLEAE